MEGVTFDEVQKKPAIDWAQAAKAGGIAALVAADFSLYKRRPEKRKSAAIWKIK